MDIKDLEFSDRQKRLMIKFMQGFNKKRRGKTKRNGIKHKMHYWYNELGKYYYFDYDEDGRFKTKKELYKAMKDYHDNCLDA